MFWGARVWRLGVAVIAGVLAGAVIAGQALAASYTVNSAGDTNSGSGTTGTLRFAITQVDTSPPSPDVINIQPGLGAITLS